MKTKLISLFCVLLFSNGLYCILSDYYKKKNNIIDELVISEQKTKKVKIGFASLKLSIGKMKNIYHIETDDNKFLEENKIIRILSFSDGILKIEYETKYRVFYFVYIKSNVQNSLIIRKIKYN